MRLLGVLLLLISFSYLFSGEIHDFVIAGDLTKVDSVLSENSELLNSLNDNGDSPFMLAVINGHVELVEYFLEKGVDAKKVLDNGTSAIHIAAFEGFLDIAKLLTENGCDINSLNTFGFSAFHLSIYKDHHEIQKYFLENGADYQLADTRYGATAVHWACNRGNLELLRTFIENGVDIEIQDLQGNSPLHWATFAERPDIVKFLLENGANIDQVDNGGTTPIFDALYRGNLDMLKLLAENGADLNKISNEGKKLIHIALSFSTVEIVEYLMEKGAKIEEPVCSEEDQNCDFFFSTPIHMAVHTGPDMLNLVLKHYKDINKPDQNGNTPLVSSMWSDSLDVAEILLANGAEVNTLDNQGRSILYKATERGRLDMVELLLKHEAYVNVADNIYKKTPLHLAAARGYSDLASLLVENGAKINAKSNDKKTPLYLANYYNNETVADLLRSKKGKIKPKMKNALTSLDDLDLSEDEALIVYLYHAGWTILTQNTALILDGWFEGKVPDNPNLFNGWVQPEELKGRKVYVLSSHEHRDHWSTEFFDWANKLDDITYIMGFKPENTRELRNNPIELPEYNFVSNRMTQDYNGLKLHTFPATDAGVGFLIEVDGFTILHPGDHANADMEMEERFTAEIDYLAEMKKEIDFAFFPMTGCGFPEIEPVKEGIFYSIRKLGLKNIFPMHVSNDTYKLIEFCDECKEIIPETNVFKVENRGDRFLFNKNGLKIHSYSR